MHTTQPHTTAETPAQAALAELARRAQNGEKVTPEELAAAHAALNFEGFERAAQERGRIARAATERAGRIADLNAQVGALEQDKTLERARQKLRVAFESFARDCGEYEARRAEVGDAISDIHKVENDETLPALEGRWKQVEKAKMRSAVFVAARDALSSYYPGEVFELTQYSR